MKNIQHLLTEESSASHFRRYEAPRKSKGSPETDSCLLQPLAQIKNSQFSRTIKHKQTRPITSILKTLKTTVNKQNIKNEKKKTRTRSILSPRSNNLVSDSASVLAATTAKAEEIHEQILEMFEAKCFDSKIQFSRQQSIKFLQKIQKCTQNRRVNLNNSWIKLQALAAICDYLRMKDIFYLNLEKNQIGDAGAVELSKLLKESTVLVYLNVASNNIRQVGAEHIFGSLRYNQTLVELDISSKEGLNKNCIRSGTRSLKQSLRNNNSLQILNLNNTQLDTEGLRTLCLGICVNQSMCHLNLGSNDFKEHSVQDIVQMLREHELVELNLSHNGMGNDGVRTLMEFIGKHHRCTKLSELDLSGNCINSRSSSMLFDMLRKNTGLKKLVLSNNIFDTENRPLVSLLDENTQLETLDLEDCQINVSFCFSLCEGIRRTRSLLSLNLSNNSVDQECSTLLFAALQVNRSIQRLFLKNCRLDNHAANLLSDVLELNSSLYLLNLSQNYINDQGAKHILMGLGMNSTIRQLNLKSNFVSYKLLMTINKKLQNNRLEQITRKIPKYKHKLNTLENKIHQESAEVQEYDKYLKDKQTRLKEEIQYLKRQLIVKQSKLVESSSQFQTELLEADATIKILNNKMAVAKLVVDNVDNKIIQAEQNLASEKQKIEQLKKKLNSLELRRDANQSF